MTIPKFFKNINGAIQETSIGIDQSTGASDGHKVIVTDLTTGKMHKSFNPGINGFDYVGSWANKPASLTNNYTDRVFITDVGVGGSEWYWDESRYRPVGGQVILRKTNIPIGLPSNGTIGANGALTLTVAMPLTFDSGAYFYFPANAITGSNAAGFYYVVMSSTTVGTVYNNTFDPSLSASPIIPSSPAAFSGTTGQSYTQTTSAINVLQTTIPAGVISTNAEILQNVEFTYNLGAATKQFLTYVNGASITGSSRTTTGGHDSFTIRYKFLNNTKMSTYSISESGGSSSASHLINTISDTWSNQFVIARRLTTSSGATDNAIYLGLTEILLGGE